MKKVLIAAASALTLVASFGYATAQPAPENRPSTTMQKDGGHSGLRNYEYRARQPIYTGRSVAVTPYRLHRRDEDGGRYYNR